MKQAFLKKGKEESVNRFHPWIFSGAIHHFSEQPEEGEVIQIFASIPKENEKGMDFKFVAVGHYQIGSIMVRILAFDNVLVNQSFYENKIRRALNVRVAAGILAHSSMEDPLRNI